LAVSSSALRAVVAVKATKREQAQRERVEKNWERKQ
jgi:hypothetical protein